MKSREPSKKVPEKPADARSSGVDLSLVNHAMALSPEERLRQNDRMVNMANALRHAFERGAHEGD